MEKKTFKRTYVTIASTRRQYVCIIYQETSGVRFCHLATFSQPAAWSTGPLFNRKLIEPPWIYWLWCCSDQSGLIYSVYVHWKVSFCMLWVTMAFCLLLGNFSFWQSDKVFYLPRKQDHYQSIYRAQWLIGLKCWTTNHYLCIYFNHFAVWKSKNGPQTLCVFSWSLVTNIYLLAL